MVHIYKIHVFDEAFSYDYQTFQGGDMLQGALTHIYAWHEAEWSCGVTWQIKYISLPAEDVSIHTTQGAILP